MKQTFCITYGGRVSRRVMNYVPYKAIAHTADEAIAIINTWKTYGGERAYCTNIVVNARTEQKIRDLFRDGLGDRQWETMRTTGCGAWDITFYPALADTIEEHNRIYNERREAAKAERMKLAEAAKQKRLAELNEQRKGWYHVEIGIRVMVFANRGNDYHDQPTFSCSFIAESGMDAYNKVVKYIQDHPEEIMVRGCQTALETWAEPTSQHFNFTFLGVKTDEGYSVKLWEEWKNNGQI